MLVLGQFESEVKMMQLHILQISDNCHISYTYRAYYQMPQVVSSEENQLARMREGAYQGGVVDRGMANPVSAGGTVGGGLLQSASITPKMPETPWKLLAPFVLPV